ncbi:MAG: transglutaminase-like domain-containing protein [Pirellulaceae bacterium]|nr:transglutaminase-like domain-containing protein [Pirellulaceae bacterium]
MPAEETSCGAKRWQSCLNCARITIFTTLWVCSQNGCQDPQDTHLTGNQASTEAIRLATSGTNDDSGDRGHAGEVWEAIYIGGKKIGHIHTSSEMVNEDGVALLVTRRITQGSILRFEQTAQMEQELIEYSHDGELVRCSSEDQSGKSAIRVDAEVRRGQLVITSNSAGTSRVTELEWNASIGGVFAVENSLRKQPMLSGESRVLNLLLPGLSGFQIVKNELTAEDYEAIEINGNNRRLLKINSVATISNNDLKSTIWVDEQGEIWRSELRSLQLVQIRTGRSDALMPEQQESFDLGIQSMVRVSRPLQDPHGSTRAVYRAELSEHDPAQAFMSTPYQTISSIDKRTAEITVLSCRPGLSVRPLSSELKKPVVEDLAPGSLIQSDHPRVVAMARAVAPNESDTKNIALELEKLVHQSIQHKNYSQAFASAAEVAQSREGDCTEHAILLAALCRVREIPARVTTGLVYAESLQAFAFHMWTEAWINEKWVGLDATLGLGGIGAAHLKLSDSNMAAGGELEAILPVMKVIQQLKLEVVEFE